MGSSDRTDDRMMDGLDKVDLGGEYIFNSCVLGQSILIELERGDIKC